MLSRYRHLLETLAVFLISLLCFTWGIANQEVTSFDSRFYLFAREMWQFGLSWFPTTYQQPYPDYPGASTWLIYGVALIAGRLNKLVAILPTAIMAASATAVSYNIGKLHQKRWGLYGVLFLLFTVMFLKSARSIALDMYPTAITACCFYLLHAAELKNQRACIPTLLFLITLGFIFRGPIGLVIPTGVICVYYLISRQPKLFFGFGFAALGLLIFYTAALLGLAYHVGGHDFMQEVLRMEVMGRIDRQSLPIYFYLKDGLAAYAFSFPVAGLVLLGAIYYSWRTPRRLPAAVFLRQLSGWLLIILIGMSIPGDKKIRYILPLVPAAALIAAYPFMLITNEKYFAFLRLVLQRLFLFFPAMLLLLVEAVYLYTQKQHLDVPICYGFIITVLVVLQLLGLAACYRYVSRLLWRETIAFVMAVVSFVFTYLLLMEPLELYRDRARDLIHAVEAQRMAAHAQLIFYRENPDGMPIKYRINMPTLMEPQFINTESELMALTKPAFVVMSANYFADLPATVNKQFRMIAVDNLGHVPVVILTKEH